MSGSDDPERTYDELAGVVDLFGALARSELERALEELAFKRGGQSADAEAISAAVDDAVDRYYLVAYEPEVGSADGTASSGDSESAGDGVGSENPGDGVGDEGANDGGEELLAVGPVAFPTLPPNAEDLPHILDVEPRDPDREALGRRVRDRFREEAARAVDADDVERVEHLLDASYDLEAWAPVDVSAERERLAAALERDDEG